jgi:hypothetical protein
LAQCLLTECRRQLAPTLDEHTYPSLGLCG